MCWKLYCKSCLKLPLKKDQKLDFKSDFGLMQVKSIAECSLAIFDLQLSTFIKVPFVFKILDLYIFEWTLKTGFTVFAMFYLKCIYILYGKV